MSLPLGLARFRNFLPGNKAVQINKVARDLQRVVQGVKLAVLGLSLVVHHIGRDQFQCFDIADLVVPGNGHFLRDHRMIVLHAAIAPRQGSGGRDFFQKRGLRV